MELLIAIVIMGLAVSVLVLAMSSLVVATEEHRGHSISDTAVRDFSEAMQQKASFTTTLSSAIADASTPTVRVADFAGFQTTLPFDILVDQEVMKVTSHVGTTLTVTRGAAGSVAVAHAISTAVTQDFICPRATASDTAVTNSAGYLYPESFSIPKSGGNPIYDVKISGIQYLNPSDNTWTNGAATCIGNFTPTGAGIGCPDGTFLPECDPGLVRVQIHVDTKLANLRNVSTDTWVLIRRGSV